MEIVFRSGKLARVSSTELEAKRRWGPRAGKVLQRLTELAAAENLADIRTLPPARCHQLAGDRRGQFAVHAGPKLRLVFEPANEPIPRNPDIGIDLAKVTKIRVLEIKDYHGE